MNVTHPQPNCGENPSSVVTDGTVFDYRKVASTLGVETATVRILEAEARCEYPDDPMMRELHLLRAVKEAARRTGR